MEQKKRAKKTASLIKNETIQTVKRTLILDAARKVFAEKGYHNSGLAEIGAKAGFSKASLYNYYHDKEAIFLSLSIREFRRILNFTQENVSRQPHIQDKLKAIFHAICSIWGECYAFFLDAEHIQYFHFSNIESVSKHHCQLSCELENARAEVLSLLTSLIANAKKAKEIELSLDENESVSYIVSLILGAMRKWRLQGKIGNVDQEVDRLVSFICYGIRPVETITE